MMKIKKGCIVYYIYDIRWKTNLLQKKQQIFLKKLAIREYTNTKDYNNAKKLEKTRVQMKFLQKQFFSFDIYTNHIIGIMWAVYFLAKKEFTY